MAATGLYGATTLLRGQSSAPDIDRDIDIDFTSVDNALRKAHTLGFRSFLEDFVTGVDLLVKIHTCPPREKHNVAVCFHKVYNRMVRPCAEQSDACFTKVWSELRALTRTMQKHCSSPCGCEIKLKLHQLELRSSEAAAGHIPMRPDPTKRAKPVDLQHSAGVARSLVKQAADHFRSHLESPVFLQQLLAYLDSIDKVARQLHGIHTFKASGKEAALNSARAQIGMLSGQHKQFISSNPFHKTRSIWDLLQLWTNCVSGCHPQCKCELARLLLRLAYSVGHLAKDVRQAKTRSQMSSGGPALTMPDTMLTSTSIRNDSHGSLHSSRSPSLWPRTPATIKSQHTASASSATSNDAVEGWLTNTIGSHHTGSSSYSSHAFLDPQPTGSSAQSPNNPYNTHRSKSQTSLSSTRSTSPVPPKVSSHCTGSSVSSMSSAGRQSYLKPAHTGSTVSTNPYRNGT